MWGASPTAVFWNICFSVATADPILQDGKFC
eukprot:CAMPEP_0172767632 /NCGR_PEP_ID=MMETSP1074-20121228/183263_1 /TAXON_ID=2916 /ORGANISM="Ceratium fusus, Strain PA161109" /LENGTH=30 /DNA_ID= /DNA_START= /DNA_END= /DNA_ORIENTATION=